MKSGDGPAVASQDPPWEQGWLWQGSISSSHRWPAVGMGLDVILLWSLPPFCSFLGVGPASCTGTRTLAIFSRDKMSSSLVGGDYLGFHGQFSCAPPTPHLCARADTGNRRRWLEGGRLQCLLGGRAGPDTRPHPPRSAAPQSLGGRRSGSFQVWGCRSPGCDRAGIDKRQVLLSSSVLRSLERTAGKAGQTEPGSEPNPALQSSQLRIVCQLPSAPVTPALPASQHTTHYSIRHGAHPLHS